MTADTVGGVWTYALDLARALSERGIEVALATMGDPLSDSQRETVERIPRLKLFESAFRLEWMEEPWRDVERAGEWLLRLESRIAPDVVHLNGYAHAALAWDAPVLVVGHSCVLSWWEAVHGVPAPPEWAEYRRRVAAGLAAADSVVTPTRAMLTALQRLYGVGCGSVVPNGCRGSSATAAKEQLVLGAGRVWDEAKNLHRLVGVAPLVPWRVAVAGDPGPAWPDDDVLLGPLPRHELAAWMARASVFVAPSSYEPFGLGPLEAAHAGCALVLGDIESLREVWGDAAVYVDPRDDAALLAGITSLCEDGVLLAEMAGRATRRAAQLSPERMALGYLAAYQVLRHEEVPA
jgi:glycosyltransferase involved in cell wall biosynthesis